MRTRNPACKFFGLLIPTFFLAAKPNAAVNLALFACCVIAMLFSRVRLRTMLGLFAPVLLAAAGMFMTGYRFSADAGMPVNADSMLITSSAMYNGLLMGSRVLVFAGAGLLFALTTDRILLVHSFRRQLHIPQVFAYGLLAAWGIFPHMAQEYRRTRAAFRARGKRCFPASPALLKPLLVKSVRWSNELAIAMESKGFSGSHLRTELEPCLIHPQDILFCILTCVILPIAILCIP